MKTPSNPQEISRYLRIPADDVFLLADLQVPELATSLVIFAYDYGRSRNHPRNRHVARVMRDRGLATLLCDLLTDEEEAEDQATERYRHDADFLARRLIAVTQWVSSYADTRRLRIFYFGGSTGGGSVLIAAAKMRGKIKAVVARGGRLDLATHSMPHVKCPTLLVVGENDPLGVELNRQALARLAAGQKELHVIPGASRLFDEPGKLVLMAQLSADWLRRIGDPKYFQTSEPDS